MQYIIFGCGVDGQKALSLLGEDRVYRFVDNNKCGDMIMTIPIISFDEMLKVVKNSDYEIVVASLKYQKELVKQLEEAGIYEYMIFNPHHAPNYGLNGRVKYPSCQEIINNFKIDRYNRIAVYGNCDMAKFILNEISVSDIGCEVVHVCSTEEINFGKYDAMLICISRSEDSVRDSEWIKRETMPVMDIFDMYKFEMEFYHPELERFKDIHKGKRIFVIGNGPSLRIEDLDKLYEHGEICIAVNKIYRAFDKMKFRPDYLCFSDGRVINDCEDDIKNLSVEVIVADTYHLGIQKQIDGVQYYHIIHEKYYPNYPGFSDDIVRGCFMGYTVVYDVGIQMAAYMGASEIYLLGVDFSFTNNMTDNNNYFIKDYYKEYEKKNYANSIFEKEALEKSFEKAELYSREHGFRIFNATRGGKLEIFERVEFNSLFLEK